MIFTQVLSRRFPAVVLVAVVALVFGLLVAIGGVRSTATAATAATENKPECAAGLTARGWSDSLNKARFAGPDASGVVTFWAPHPMPSDFWYRIDVAKGPNRTADGDSVGFTNYKNFGGVDYYHPCEKLKLAKCGVSSELVLRGDGGFDDVRLPAWTCPPPAPAVKVTSVGQSAPSSRAPKVRVSGTVNRVANLSSLTLVLRRLSNVPAGRCVWLANSTGATFTTSKVNGACSAPTAARLAVSRDAGSWTKLMTLAKGSRWSATSVGVWKIDGKTVQKTHTKPVTAN